MNSSENTEQKIKGDATHQKMNSSSSLTQDASLVNPVLKDQKRVIRKMVVMNTNKLKGLGIETTIKNAMSKLEKDKNDKGLKNTSLSKQINPSISKINLVKPTLVSSESTIPTTMLTPSKSMIFVTKPSLVSTIPVAKPSLVTTIPIFKKSVVSTSPSMKHLDQPRPQFSKIMIPVTKQVVRQTLVSSVSTTSAIRNTDQSTLVYSNPTIPVVKYVVLPKLTSPKSSIAAETHAEKITLASTSKDAIPVTNHVLQPSFAYTPIVEQLYNNTANSFQNAFDNSAALTSSAIKIETHNSKDTAIINATSKPIETIPTVASDAKRIKVLSDVSLNDTKAKLLEIDKLSSKNLKLTNVIKGTDKLVNSKTTSPLPSKTSPLKMVLPTKSSSEHIIRKTVPAEPKKTTTRKGNLDPCPIELAKEHSDAIWATTNPRTYARDDVKKLLSAKIMNKNRLQDEGIADKVISQSHEEASAAFPFRSFESRNKAKSLTASVKLPMNNKDALTEHTDSDNHHCLEDKSVSKNLLPNPTPASKLIPTKVAFTAKTRNTYCSPPPMENEFCGFTIEEVNKSSADWSRNLSFVLKRIDRPTNFTQPVRITNCRDANNGRESEKANVESGNDQWILNCETGVLEEVPQNVVCNKAEAEVCPKSSIIEITSSAKQLEINSDALSKVQAGAEFSQHVNCYEAEVCTEPSTVQITSSAKQTEINSDTLSEVQAGAELPQNVNCYEADVCTKSSTVEITSSAKKTEINCDTLSKVQAGAEVPQNVNCCEADVCITSSTVEITSSAKQTEINSDALFKVQGEAEVPQTVNCYEAEVCTKSSTEESISSTKNIDINADSISLQSKEIVQSKPNKKLPLSTQVLEVNMGKAQTLLHASPSRTESKEPVLTLSSISPFSAKSIIIEDADDEISDIDTVHRRKTNSRATFKTFENYRKSWYPSTTTDDESELLLSCRPPRPKLRKSRHKQTVEQMKIQQKAHVNLLKRFNQPDSQNNIWNDEVIMSFIDGLPNRIDALNVKVKRCFDSAAVHKSNSEGVNNAELVTNMDSVAEHLLNVDPVATSNIEPVKENEVCSVNVNEVPRSSVIVCESQLPQKSLSKSESMENADATADGDGPSKIHKITIQKETYVVTEVEDNIDLALPTPNTTHVKLEKEESPQPCSSFNTIHIKKDLEFDRRIRNSKQPLVEMLAHYPKQSLVKMLAKYVDEDTLKSALKLDEQYIVSDSDNSSCGSDSDSDSDSETSNDNVNRIFKAILTIDLCDDDDETLHEDVLQLLNESSCIEDPVTFKDCDSTKTHVPRIPKADNKREDIESCKMIDNQPHVIKSEVPDILSETIVLPDSTLLNDKKTTKSLSIRKSSSGENEKCSATSNHINVSAANKPDKTTVISKLNIPQKECTKSSPCNELASFLQTENMNSMTKDTDSNSSHDFGDSENPTEFYNNDEVHDQISDATKLDDSHHADQVIEAVQKLADVRPLGQISNGLTSSSLASSNNELLKTNISIQNKSFDDALTQADSILKKRKKKRKLVLTVEELKESFVSRKQSYKNLKLFDISSESKSSSKDSTGSKRSDESIEPPNKQFQEQISVKSSVEKLVKSDPNTEPASIDRTQIEIKEDSVPDSKNVDPVLTASKESDGSQQQSYKNLKLSDISSKSKGSTKHSSGSKKVSEPMEKTNKQFQGQISVKSSVEMLVKSDPNTEPVSIDRYQNEIKQDTVPDSKKIDPVLTASKESDVSKQQSYKNLKLSDISSKSKGSTKHSSGSKTVSEPMEQTNKQFQGQILVKSSVEMLVKSDPNIEPASIDRTQIEIEKNPSPDKKNIDPVVLDPTTCDIPKPDRSEKRKLDKPIEVVSTAELIKMENGPTPKRPKFEYFESPEILTTKRARKIKCYADCETSNDVEHSQHRSVRQSMRQPNRRSSVFPDTVDRELVDATSQVKLSNDITETPSSTFNSDVLSADVEKPRNLSARHQTRKPIRKPKVLNEAIETEVQVPSRFETNYKSHTPVISDITESSASSFLSEISSDKKRKDRSVRQLTRQPNRESKVSKKIADAAVSVLSICEHDALSDIPLSNDVTEDVVEKQETSVELNLIPSKIGRGEKPSKLTTVKAASLFVNEAADIEVGVSSNSKANLTSDIPPSGDISEKPSSKVVDKQENSTEGTVELTPSKTGRGIKPPELAPVKAAAVYTCGNCKEQVQGRDWKKHMNSHYGLAWRTGIDPPYDIENSNSMAQRIISYTKKENIRFLKCKKCGVEKKSALGYLSHVEMCGLTDEEFRSKLVKCEYCPKVVRSCSIRAHEMSCSGLKKLLAKEKEASKQSDSTSKKDCYNDQGRIVRQSAKKALTSFKEIGKAPETKVEDYIQRAEKVQNKQQRRWMQLLKENDSINCVRIGCLFKAEDMPTMLQHFNTCVLVNGETFYCTRCNYGPDNREKIEEHIKANHTLGVIEAINDVDFSDSDDDAEVGEESSESEGVSGVDENAENEFDHDGDNFDDDDDDDGWNVRGYKKKRIKDSGHNLAMINSCLDRKVLNEHATLLRSYTSGPFFQPTLEWTQDFVRDKHFSTVELLPFAMPNKFSVLSSCLTDAYAPKVLESNKFFIKQVRKYNKQFGSTEVNKIDQWKTLKKFEAMKQNDSIIFFTGGPIISMAWLPVPDDHTLSQILAVCCRNDPNEHILLNNTKQTKCLIQIWNFNNLKNNQLKHAQAPQLLYSIAYNYGPVIQMEFCPSGGFTEDRLGLLAVSSCDGHVDLLALPKNITCDNSVSDLIFVIEPSLVLCCDLNEPLGVLVTKLVWSQSKGHTKLAAGYSNGMVAIWNFKNVESPNICNRINGTLKLLPTDMFFAAHKCIRLLEFHHDEKNEARWLVVGSHDRKVRFYDTHNVFLEISTAVAHSRIVAGCWPMHWSTFLIGIDNAYSFKIAGIVVKQPLDIGCRTGTFYSCIGSTCDISFNNWLNSYVFVSSYGDIYVQYIRQMVSGFSDIRRQRFIIGFTDMINIEKINVNENETAIEGDNMEEVNEPQPSTSSAVYCKQSQEVFYPTSDGIIFCDFDTPLPAITSPTYEKIRAPPMDTFNMVKVNKILFNPNVSAYRLYALGYESGLVRIKQLKKKQL